MSVSVTEFDALIAVSEDWQASALCAQVDPDAFFPEKGGSTREAKRICGGCDVRAECLDYALAHDERFGIWGGLSERERRRLRPRQFDWVVISEQRAAAPVEVKDAPDASGPRPRPAEAHAATEGDAGAGLTHRPTGQQRPHPDGPTPATRTDGVPTRSRP